MPSLSRYLMFAAIGFQFLITAPTQGAEPEKRPAIYDTKADASKDIDAALKRAQRHGTRVLLKYGANWCGWCHKLHALFDDNKEVKTILRDDYEVVLIDVDKDHNAAVVEKYGNPTQHGLPVLVVLDENGRQLLTQETGSLEKGKEHDPAKLIAFLKKNRAEQKNAEAVLSAGLKRARKSKRKPFVYLTASWCPWCHRLEDFLTDPDVEQVFNNAFEPVLIDTEHMKRGGEILRRFQSGEDVGIPYFVVLDATGEKLADSIGEKGNVGFPVEKHEVNHFLDILKNQAPSISAAQREMLTKKLAAAAPAPAGH